MITITKKTTIKKGTTKLGFKLDNELPEGEYEMKLVIDEKCKVVKEKYYSLENWNKTGLKLDFVPNFGRDDIYGDDGR